MTQQAKIYECVAVDLSTQNCTHWEIVENSLPLSKSDANFLTLKILGFMIFVFILKYIKKSI